MPSALINVMSAAAVKAGKGLLRDFGEVDRLQISRKGTSNFVTSADKRTEKILIDELKKARPEFGFLVEESGEIKGRDRQHRWIVDPLDGTSNFIHALPYFCISIALERMHADGQREIVAGLIYDVIHNEIFHAEKGRGAFLGDRKIAVSRRDMLADTMIVTGNPRYTELGEACSFDMLKSASMCGACVRYSGATALDLAYIAAGRYDAGWYPRQQPWDVAAGILLVHEAGGQVTQIGGEPYVPGCPTFIASNTSLHPQLLKLLAGTAGKN